MMCTRTIATGPGITGSADCPQAFPQSGNPVPLGLWCCAVSSPVAAPGLTRTYMLTAYTRQSYLVKDVTKVYYLVSRPAEDTYIPPTGVTQSYLPR